MDNLTAGNPKAHRIRVYFEGTGTIYEGQPVCYNWDSTDNWFGGSVSNGEVTATTTTAEGSQNEGKYIRVEVPATANLHAFAGIIARGGWCGKTGPRVLDIYVPNGAIVPVRTDASCVVGVTALGIADADTECVSGGAPVAIAWETVDRSGTNGVTLAKLDPDMFVRQVVTFNALTGAVPNTLQNTFANTSGSVCNLLVHTTVNGALAAAHNEWAGLFYLNISGSITAAGYTRCVLAQLNVSGTINGGAHLAAIHAQLSGAPTLTAGEHLACLWVDGAITGIDNGGDPTDTIEYSLIKMTNNGGSDDIIENAFYIYGGHGIDKLFTFNTCLNGGAADEHFISNGGDGGAEKGIATTSGWLKVKVDVDGTDYWMILYHTPTEVDMVS